MILIPRPSEKYSRRPERGLARVLQIAGNARHTNAGVSVMTERSARNDAAAQARRGPTRSGSSGAHRIVSKRPSAEREQASVQRYFDRFAAAMTSGDMKTMLALWGVPAFVIGTHEARVVQSEAEVEQFFSGSKDLYNRRGIVATRAEITNLDWIGEELVIATVRWPYLDQNERVVGEESSSYTLLRGEDGGYKLRVITMRGGSSASLDAEPPDAGEHRDGTDGE